MSARGTRPRAARPAGTGARTRTGTPPGARPAAPCRSGPAPARPPWRPPAGTATTTDGPSSTASAKVLGAGRNLRTMRTPARALGRWAVRPEGEGLLVGEGSSRLASPTRSPGARIVPVPVLVMTAHGRGGDR